MGFYNNLHDPICIALSFMSLEKRSSREVCDGFRGVMLAFGAAESHSDKATEKARLRFAHAETVIPFTCLLGLFLEDDGNVLFVFPVGFYWL